MRPVFFPLIGVAAVAAVATGRAPTPACTIAAERSLLLIHVEKDTMLPHAEADAEFMSASGVGRGPHDSLLVVAGTPMPGGRVRLLRMDSLTQASLRAEGITDPRPVAFIRAAPYRQDCRTVRWTDSRPWLERGDTGYARATLAPRAQWIAGAPLFLIRNTFHYPYPRQRGLAYDIPADRPLASAEAMYSLNVMLETGGRRMRDYMVPADSASTRRALEWTRDHLSDAELDPIRELVSRAILSSDWDAARRLPSRLRGSYAVTMESDGSRGTWYFRTQQRPSSRWGDTTETVATLLASPHIFGYQLVGYAAPTRDELLLSPPRLTPTSKFADQRLVWLTAADRPTAPGNEARQVLRGELAFLMGVPPAALWNALDPFMRPLSRMDSVMLQRRPELYVRENRQGRLPITLRLDRSGAVRADTVLTMNERTLRISLVRLDTISVASRF